MVEPANFVPVLEEKELQEGKMKLVRIEGLPILLIKQQGQIYVIDDRCPHMGCAFSGGTLEGTTIICPCHDWRFNLKTREYEEEPLIKITSYEWKIESGKIWVKIAEE
jgi:3-phenylpropionate/trans-cinnamate dioxygenase ferredoxin subunit